MKKNLQKILAMTVSGALAVSGAVPALAAEEIIQASDYSDASSNEDTTELFAGLNLQAARESIVLLENNGALPLDEGTRITYLAAGDYKLSGSGSGGTRASEEATVTAAEGIEANEKLVLVREVADERPAMPMFPGMEIETEAEEELVKDFTEFLEHEEKAAEYAADSDTAVIWISRQPGEGNDRYATEGDWYLSEEERKALELATEYFEKTIVVLNLPSIDMAWVDEYDVDAVILFGYAGAQGGNALAEILSGETNPSGKLTDTLASIESYPSMANFNTFALGVNEFTMTDESIRRCPWWLDTPNPAYGYDNGDWIRPVDEYYFTKYEEGIYNGYRYFSTFGDIVAAYNETVSEEERVPFEVYYEFGYGLSYTTFDLEITECVLPQEVPTTENDLQISITAEVTNTGNRAGKEVVELYYGAPDGVLENPAQELVAFAKTDELQTGESQSVTITFDVYDMADWYETDAAYILIGGDYQLYVGNSLSDAKEHTAVYTLDVEDYTVVRKGSNLAGPCQEGGTYDQYEDEYPEIVLTEMTKADYANTKPDGAEGIIKNDTEIEDHVVGGSVTRDRFQAAINGEDGTENYVSPDPDKTYTQYYNDMVDAANDAIAAAQELYKTEGKAEYQLIDVYEGTCTMEEYLAQWTDIELLAYVVGAGRVGQVFHESEDGSDGTQGNDRLGVPAVSVKDGPNMVGSCNGTTTTAWLCGTNRAQTWNENLIYEIGVASGYECVAGSTEMLLGPALNVHRNPLCGRNYEYFSEDPVISGVMAAALVKGIQESGSGVTLKHFAANQMEGENNDRWNKLDSVMSERTLREIYLKGFEIVTKTADPTGVMTAYNMINGKYASCADELLEIMKEEWGFDGLSMTDWSGDWGNPVTMLQTATDIAMPSNLYMLAYLNHALTVAQKEGRGLTYQEAGGKFDEGKMLTRDDLEKCAANLLNTTMQLQVFADYYDLDYTPDYSTGTQFEVELSEK